MENLKNFEIEEDVRQSSEYGKFMEKIGWETIGIGKTKGSQIFVRKLGPVAIAKIQRPKGEVEWKEVERIAKDKRVMMIKFEPSKATTIPKGYKIDSWPLMGTKTLRVDLKPTESEILSGFNKDCRYSIRQAIKSGQSVEINNFDLFYEVWSKSAKRKNLWIPSLNSYQNLIRSFAGKCFCVTLGQQAGASILIHKETAFYYYAGATREGNRDNLPYLVVWTAMKESKRQGCKIWDFEGIYDARWPNKGWKGFTHFKKQFGGEIIEFPGCFTKWRWPF